MRRRSVGRIKSPLASVSLQAPCHVKSTRASTGPRRSPSVGERQRVACWVACSPTRLWRVGFGIESVKFVLEISPGAGSLRGRFITLLEELKLRLQESSLSVVALGSLFGDFAEDALTRFLRVCLGSQLGASVPPSREARAS